MKSPHGHSVRMVSRNSDRGRSWEKGARGQAWQQLTENEGWYKKTGRTVPPMRLGPSRQLSGTLQVSRQKKPSTACKHGKLRMKQR